MDEAGRTLAPLGATAWIASWLLCGGAVVLGVVGGLVGSDAPFFVSTTFWGLDLLVGVVNGPAAWLVLSRSRHVVGVITAVVAVGFALAAFCLAYGVWAHGRGAPGAGLLGHAFSWVWIPGAVTATVSMPWLLRPDRPGRLATWVAASGAVVAVLVAGCAAMLQQPGAPRNPLALPDAAGPTVTLVGQALLWLAAALGVVAVAQFGRRWRQETGSGRRALAAVFLALVLLLVSFTGLQVAGDGSLGETVRTVLVTLLFVSQVLLPVAVLVLVLRERMWGVEVVVSRATVWGLLSAFVVAAYVVLVWAAGQVLPWSTRVGGAVSAALLALAVQPARRWLQVRVDRLVYGTEPDAGAVMSRVGARLRDGDDALGALVDGLRHSLRLGAVEVVDAQGATVARSGGDAAGRTGDDAVFPLVLDGRERGTLLLAPRPGERLDLRTRLVVAPLVDVVAVALDLAVVNADLERTSQRLVDVRHEERRLLRRELHDGLGPAMAGVALGLAAARRRVAYDVAGAVALLAELEREVASRTEDVRDVAHALLPPQLDDGDLGGALDLLARRHTTATLAVTVDVEPGSVGDTARQVAIYRVAAEALVNAHRHARAARVRIEVARGDDGVVLTVADDGTGIAVDHVPGVGLRSMRERAEELGGRTDVTGRPGEGTTVRTTLP